MYVAILKIQKYMPVILLLGINNKNYYFYLITGFNDALFHVRLTNFIVKHRFF